MRRSRPLPSPPTPLRAIKYSARFNPDGKPSGNQALRGTNIGLAQEFGFGGAPADGRGGAIGAGAGNVSVSNSTITGNLAEGGALSTSIQGGTVVDNVGFQASGGGIDD